MLYPNYIDRGDFLHKPIETSLKNKLPSLNSSDCDAQKLKQPFYHSKGKLVQKNLEKNGFSAYYTDSVSEAASLLFSLIPQDAVIGCGDSHTLFALQIEEWLKNDKNCTIISHRCALNENAVSHPVGLDLVIGTPEEMREVLIQYLLSDVFLLGANAITLDGKIVNTDGRGNRVVGGIFGPKRIIVVAGMNKVVSDLAAAQERIGFIAAPINNIKYQQEPPCVKTGKCMDCHSPQRICNVTTIIHRQPENADYHVILIGEDLGF